MSIILAILAAGITLSTYQVFYSGLWGKLHNDSKQPHLELKNVQLYSDCKLKLGIYRDGGPDTYGSFVVDVKVSDHQGNIIADYGEHYLSNLDSNAIENRFVYQKIKKGPYSLIIPLAADGMVTLTSKSVLSLQSREEYKVTVFDVSGTSWSVPLR